MDLDLSRLIYLYIYILLLYLILLGFLRNEMKLFIILLERFIVF